MKRQPQTYDGPTTLGIDVSTYQGTIDWAKVAMTTDVTFAFIRTGDGRSTDKQFERNWEESDDVGLFRGAYHYFRADRDGETQARHVVKLIKDAGGFTVDDLPPVLDLEGGSAKNLPGGVFTEVASSLPIPLIVEECIEFLKVIEDELHVRPLIYTGQAFHWWLSQANPDLAELFAGYDLWIPDYRSKPHLPVDREGNFFPWKEWRFWQYSCTGKINGIEGNVDLNYFRGDSSQLVDWLEDQHHKIEKSPQQQAGNNIIRAGLISELEVLAKQFNTVIAELQELDK